MIKFNMLINPKEIFICRNFAQNDSGKYSTFPVYIPVLLKRYVNYK